MPQLIRKDPVCFLVGSVRLGSKACFIVYLRVDKLVRNGQNAACLPPHGPTEPLTLVKPLQFALVNSDHHQVPSDDRAQEIGYAASFMILVGSDFSWEGVGQVMHYDTTIPTVIGTITAAAVAIDVWKRAGCTSKMVLSGMNRLFLKDVERESRAEAGAFLTAYMTGLPCFAFQPSAVEALRCVYI